MVRRKRAYNFVYLTNILDSDTSVCPTTPKVLPPCPPKGGFVYLFLLGLPYCLIAVNLRS
jgi:hypothetical protein